MSKKSPRIQVAKKEVVQILQNQELSILQTHFLPSEMEVNGGVNICELAIANQLRHLFITCRTK